MKIFLLFFAFGVTKCIGRMVSNQSDGIIVSNGIENSTESLTGTESTSIISSGSVQNLSSTFDTNSYLRNENESLYNYTIFQTNFYDQKIGLSESNSENLSKTITSSFQPQETTLIEDIFIINSNKFETSTVTNFVQLEELDSQSILNYNRNKEDELQTRQQQELNSKQPSEVTRTFNLAHQSHESESTPVDGELAQHLSTEYRLINDLLSQYNKNIRPVTEAGSISHILVELSLFDILKLDTKQQVLQTNTEFIMKWIDIHLVWDATKYGNISIIRVPYENIWFPDIILYNTAEPDYQSSIMYTNAIVRSNGEVELVSHSIFSSICNVDIQWYPFDQQDCVLVFASWTYDELDIQLILGPADISDFHKNPEYAMENFYGEQQQTFNPCCTYPMSTIVYHLQMQRRTKFSLFFYLMPGILINLSAVMVFSLPAESGEKIGLGINSLLAMTVFLMAMTEKLPPTEKIPLAGLYYGVCLTVITMNIAFSVFILNLNIAGDRKKKIPDWLKHVILFLTKILGNRIPECVYDDWNIDKDTRLFRNRHPIKDLLGPDNLNVLTAMGNEKSFNNTQIIEDNNKGYEDLKDVFERRVIYALEFMADHSRKSRAISLKHECNESLRNQWKFISRVLDRLLFVTFFSIAFFFNIAILTSSPFDEKFEYCPIGHGQCDEMTREEIMEMAKQMALEHAKGHGSHQYKNEKQTVYVTKTLRY